MLDLENLGDLLTQFWGVIIANLCLINFLLTMNYLYDPVEIADGFNNYFSTIGDNLASDFIPTNDFLNYMPANVTSVFFIS